MSNESQKKPKITKAASSVRVIFDAWKAMERIRTDWVVQGTKISAMQWDELQSDIYAARDSYFLAMEQFIDSPDPAVANLQKQIKECSTALADMKRDREKMGAALALVDKLAGLVGKLLALAAA